MIKCKSLNVAVPHPGVYIKNEIEALGISQNEFAIRADITPKVISTLLNGESNITFEIATKLSSFFGSSVEMWVNLQTAYESYISKQKEDAEIKREWELAKYIDKDFLLNYFDVTLDSKKKEVAIKKLREQFMVGTLTSLVSSDLFAFCRTSVQKDLTEKEMFLRNAWISLAYMKSRKQEVKTFDRNKLLSLIKELKKYTLLDPEIFTPLLKDNLAECGVKYVELPYLKCSNLSGVTRWIGNENAVMVAINDCGKDADKIWFTLFHELGHALYNHKRHLTISLKKNSLLDEEEISANKFAEDSLINPNRYHAFIKENNFSIDRIIEFAHSEEIAPFVVIGRLQKDKYIGYDMYQGYKVKYSV